MSTNPPSNAAKWLVGERLSTVLHIGDGPVAYELSEQGHEVTIAGSDVSAIRNDELTYVKADPDRLPFASNSFDVVVVPRMETTPAVLGQYARVLVADGLIATMARRYDESIPWMRKLRAITGEPPAVPAPVDTFTASGLFDRLEQRNFNDWQELDLATLMLFAEQTRAPHVSVDRLGSVHQLWQEYSQSTGSLRLRHETTCLRARVVKSALASEPDPPEVPLISLD